MKIFIAGGTGAIGRPLITQLIAKGHALVALTRSPEKAQALAEQGIEPAIADVFDKDAVEAVVRRSQPEVVIEQLTALPKTYTRQSMNAAAALTPLAFSSSPAVAAGAREASELEHRLLGNSNIEGIVLRYGFFYGPGTWFNPDGDVARQVRQRLFPIVGNGEGVWSWLHIDDAAIATVAAAEEGNPGIYLIADDQPLAVRKWLSAFAHWLNAPPPPQISVEDALKASGADTVYYGTQMRGVSNARAKRELKFQPRPLEWIGDSAVAHAG